MWGRSGIAIWAIGFAMVATPTFGDNVADLQQGWSAQQKNIWYTRSQGSRLIPLSWLIALKQPDSDQPFLDDAYIQKFRYLPNPSTNSTDRLPVGFVIDQRDDSTLSNTKLRWKISQRLDEKWVGMNCSACHTAEITYNGKTMRAEGGPTLADFQGFTEALIEALIETKNNPDKTKSFAADVLKGDNSPANGAMLSDALTELIEWQQKVEKANATPLRYGFGRLDAFGHIFNKIALVVAADDQTFHPSNAPVSYPFLWNVPQHDKVQWNGIVANQRIGNAYDIGALGRNTGEVTGVFADVHFKKRALSGPSVVSSASISNLDLLESQLRTLRPPLWPTGVLGVLDQKKRDAGREIFRDESRTLNGQPVKSCATCHRPLARNNLRALIIAKMTPLREAGTDIWMACNAVTNEAKTGVLEKSLYAYLPFVDIRSQLYGASAKNADMLRTTVIGTIWENRVAVIKDFAGTLKVPTQYGLGSTDEAPSALPASERPLRSTAAEDRRNQCLNGTDPLLAYKGRPLTGIWATAPYLHNGSVPTLYDLLLTPDQRPKSFPVGTREFDPVRVGYKTRNLDGTIAPASGDNSFMFQTRDAAGRVIDGNSNSGHDYGNASLSEDDRLALVEYLKGL
jgi:hypothetical protein